MLCMKKIFVIMLFLSGALRLPAQIVVAVTGFDNQSDILYLDSWERNVPALLQSELALSPKITIVERRKLDAVFNEQKLALSGFADTTHAQNIGKLLEADFIIRGSILHYASLYRIDVDITRVKTGEVIHEKVEAGDADHLPQMIELLANNVLFHLTGETPYRSRISVRKYPTVWFMAATVGFGVVSAVYHNKYLTSYDKYHQAVTPPEMDAHINDAEAARVVRNTALSLGAAALIGTIYAYLQNRKIRDITAYKKERIRVQPTLHFKSRESIHFALQFRF